MPPTYTCHECPFTKLSNSPRDGCRNLVSHGQRKQQEPYNILEHPCDRLPPCVKRVSKAATTYRDYFCGKKCIPKPQSICLPYTALHSSDEKMCSNSIYKDDFHPYSRKDQDKNRGMIITQKNNIVSGKQCFTGKSETRFAYKPPDTRKNNYWNVFTAENKDVKGVKDNVRFAHVTTYSSEYKKPKVNLKTDLIKPKHNVSVSRDQFRHISQYTIDYTKPQKKISGRPSKKHLYIPSSIPMEGITTYKESFTLKAPISGPRPRRHSDLRCKECKRSSAVDQDEAGNVGTKWKFSVCGDGDKILETGKPPCLDTNSMCTT